MGQSAEWWREYRRRNADRLREYDRQRRRENPRRRAQLKASEAKRRKAKRAKASTPDVPMAHELLDWAFALVPAKRSGIYYTFSDELLAEDLRSEAILAKLEGRNVREAIQAFKSQESQWSIFTTPWPENDLLP